MCNLEEVIAACKSDKDGGSSTDETFNMIEDQEEHYEVMIEYIASSMAEFEASRKNDLEDEGFSRKSSNGGSDEDEEKQSISSSSQDSTTSLENKLHE